MKKLSQEEAEKVLEDMKSKGEIPKAAVTQWKRNTALDMAIEALKYSEVPNSSDCISRQAAIDALGELATFTEDWSCHTWMYTDDVYNAIKQLPTIQPKRGKWILDRSGAYCCSECMEPCASYVMMKPRDKFCKMCGSRNEVTT